MKSIFDINMTKKHKKQYEKLQIDLMRKRSIGILTPRNACKILDAWMTTRGY